MTNIWHYKTVGVLKSIHLVGIRISRIYIYINIYIYKNTCIYIYKYICLMNHVDVVDGVIVYL